MRPKPVPTPRKRIHNPVTGKYYAVRQRSSKFGKKGQIKGAWTRSSRTGSRK